MPAAMVYTCRVTNWPMFWINVVYLVSLIGTLTLPTGLSWWSVLLIALLPLNLVVTFVAISQRVAAGPAGLTVSLGPFGVPRVRVSRASIAHAEMIFLPQTLWSGEGVGWGVKHGWRLTPRLGPALRLRLTSGRTITVSMPEPAAAMWAMGIAR
ncbi:hypothetical protein ATM97_01400 [Nocardia sp. MH4]|uniref:hypothetical protein n=1 Tax=Nocardia sp. MH4 TaxID=1768677 RepID=UPI001C4F0B5A|nr:hypothetical protein [Nocardia sp. MH4]MBW0269808.1 hypothetical protein [Nocardia sp. MH4]